ETTASVPRVAAVGVDHDLAAGETRICNRSADHEAPGRIDEGARAGAHFVREHRIDHVLCYVRSQLFGIDLLMVLRRDDDVVHRLRLAVVAVAHRDLDL